MSDASGDEEESLPMDTVTVEVSVEDNNTVSETVTETDALLLAHARDQQSLAVSSIRAAYEPFEIEYKECLEQIFDGNTPNPDDDAAAPSSSGVSSWIDRRRRKRLWRK